MIEDLSIEKLKEYGFDDMQIERLRLWDNYECQCYNNKGHFFASNVEKKIYSGNEAKDKSDFKLKTTFKTFDELFEMAVIMDTIERPKDLAHREALKAQYNYIFNVWLQENKKWEYGNANQYVKLLTKENWIEFLKHEAEQEKNAKEKFNLVKQSWQIDMKEEKDTRFWLTTFFDEQVKNTDEYKFYKREINSNGSFNFKTESDEIKVYTPELTVIFTSPELPARNMDTQVETKIDGSKYFNSYLNGYIEGGKYFETEFAIAPSALYGEKAELYVRDIHANYYHTNHKGAHEGWKFVKKMMHIILTHKLIREYGYYSGIVNKVEAMVKKYPKLFQTFDKCDHELAAPKLETQINIIENLDIMIFTYETFLLNCDNKFSDIKSINKLCRQLYDDEIYNVAHRAFQEIKKLTFSPNPNADRLLNFYSSKANQLIEKINGQISANKLDHADNMPTFASYFETVQPLFDFIDSLAPLIQNMKYVPANTALANTEKEVIKKPEFTLAEIALKCFYEGRKITRENSNTIAIEYGYKSGENLFQRFTKYSSRQNRIAKESTQKKSLNKLALIEKVIPKLLSFAKQQATDEMITLKAAIEKDNE